MRSVRPRSRTVFLVIKRWRTAVSQAIPVEEQNAPGFYYIVRWRRLAGDNSSSSRPGASGAEYDVQERTIDAATSTLTLSGQPVYRPYEMVVLAANEMGEAEAVDARCDKLSMQRDGRGRVTTATCRRILLRGRYDTTVTI